MAVINDILDAVETIIDGLSLPGSPRVVVRKRFWIGETDEHPIVIVVPGKPSIDTEHTENIIVWARPVWVGFTTATGDGRFESEILDLPNYEQSIRRALHKPGLSGVASVFDADVAPETVFIENAADTGYDLTALQVTFLSTESRSS